MNGTLVSPFFIRAVSKIIQCIGRFTDEIILEPQNNRLEISAWDGSQSLCALFTLKRAFFDLYEFDNAGCRVKVAVRNLIPALKGLQIADNVAIRIDQNAEKVIITHVCKMDITKTFRWSYEDGSEAEKVSYSNNSRHRILVRPKVFLDALQSISVQMISLHCGRDRLKLTSFFDDTRGDPNRMLHTEVTFQHLEFEGYDVDADEIAITFNVKEFKAILQLSDWFSGNLTLGFNEPGEPLVLSLVPVSGDLASFDVAFVLSTLRGPGDGGNTCSLAPLPAETLAASPRKSSKALNHHESSGRVESSQNSVEIHSPEDALSDRDNHNYSDNGSVNGGDRSAHSPDASPDRHDEDEEMFSSSPLVWRMRGPRDDVPLSEFARSSSQHTDGEVEGSGKAGSRKERGIIDIGPESDEDFVDSTPPQKQKRRL
eukprot:Rmarinus@m.10704